VSTSRWTWLAVGALCALTACAAPHTAIRGAISHPLTRDGWPLTLEHFAPAGGTTPHARPIILCHGLFSNRRFFALEGDASLPIVLSRAGFDVWLADVRGRPDAGSPGFWFGTHTYDYDFDDFVRYDADTILTQVLAETHAHDAAWVGHSLGGMMGYARAGAFHDARIGALVTVASPVVLAPASRTIARGILAKDALWFLPALPIAWLASFEANLGLRWFVPNELGDMLFSQTNPLTPATYALLQKIAVNNGSKREVRQLARSVRRGELVSADGTVSYAAPLGDIDVPALVIVGRADEIADPAVGREAFERLGSKDKELLVAGRLEGFAADYGHVDLLIGPAARRDIFPRIVAWLAAHDGP
jgi:polyhydroxyalkanoate synthase